MDLSKKWDKASPFFSVDSSGQTPLEVADNVEILWPAVVKKIKHLKLDRCSRILDFGCGTGGFCRLLAKKYQVTGIDFSKEMIVGAKKSGDSKTKYLVGDKTLLKKYKNRFSVIASLMVLQFVDDVSTFLEHFHQALVPGGFLVFAVFNPRFVNACLKKKIMFCRTQKSQLGMNLHGVRFPVFLRTEQDYRSLCQQAGLKFVSCFNPRFTKQFAKKYAWPLPINIPEFLVVVAKKI